MGEMKTIKGFDREELQTITKRAEEMANIADTNPAWARVCQQLSNAADCLDAIMARTRETPIRCRFTKECMGLSSE